jgi:hypothetical protein
MDCVGVINVLFVSDILRYEMIVFSTWKMHACGYYPTLTVNDRHTDFISVCISCAERKYSLRIPMSLMLMSDDITGSLIEIIQYMCMYD